MSKRSDLVKSIIKSNVDELTEDAVLNTFLKSRGLNPLHVSKDQKVAHSKMGEFLKWKRDHMYENHIAIAMGKMLDDESGMVLTQIEELERGCAMIRSYIGKDYEKQLPAWVQAKITLATDYMSTVGNYLVSKNENVKEAHDPWQDKHFGPTKVIKQKYHVKTDTKSYNVKADNEEHAHKLVTKHAPGSKIVSIEHKGRMMEEVEINELNKSTLASYAKKATDDATYHSFSAGTRSAKDPQRLKDDEKAMKRQSGVNKAIDRLSKEEVEQADESYNGPRGDKLIAVSHAAYDTGDKAKSKRAHALAMKAGEKYRSNPVNRDKSISHIMSGANKDYTSGKRYTGDSVEHSDENVISEISDTTLTSYKDKAKKSADTLHAQGQYKKSANRWLNVMKATGKQIDKMQKENTLDPKAATGAPNDCANSPDDVVPKDKNKKLIQMSKSARIIKSIYHRKNMKEETFDTEKEDKSVATYGKKPKVTDNQKKMENIGGKPNAASIMSGGTTLTGTPRDTVEIDPMMQLKPGLMGQSGQAIKPKNNNR